MRASGFNCQSNFLCINLVPHSHRVSAFGGIKRKVQLYLRYEWPNGKYTQEDCNFICERFCVTRNMHVYETVNSDGGGVLFQLAITMQDDRIRMVPDCVT